MVPKVAGKGASFKGAGLYYLHDKGALSRDRVLFTLTENLATNDPELAIRMMAHTAIHQQRIKERAGGSAKGRKLTQPVYTYSLSWAPDETPTQQQMIEAARGSLAALGLQDHETLFVAHKDEPHPHIHIIVNRVDPRTGIAAKLANDHLKLSAWAEAYEKQQGLVRCEQRVENNKRRKKQYVKDAGNDNSAAFHQWRRDRIEHDVAARHTDAAALSAAHRAQRQSLFAQKEQDIRISKKQIREDNRRHWQNLYQFEKQDRYHLGFERRQAAAQLKNFLKSAGKGFFHAEDQSRTGHLSIAFGGAVDFDRKHAELGAKYRDLRTALSERVKTQQREAFAAINSRYKADLDALKERQHFESHDLALRQAAESQRTAADITAGTDIAAFREQQMDLKRALFAKNAQDILQNRPRPARAFIQVAKDRARAAPAFKKSAQDRVRPAKAFAAAAKDRQRTAPQFNAAAKAPKHLTPDFTPAASRAEAAMRTHAQSEREQKVDALLRDFAENAQEVTGPMTSVPEPERGDDKGDYETSTRRDGKGSGREITKTTRKHHEP